MEVKRMKEIKKVAVLGAGLMGKQIALNTAQYGYDVKLYDSFPEALDAAGKWAEDYLAGRVEKGKMTADQVAEIKKHFALEKDLKTCVQDADLVIEAIIEDRAIKEVLFTDLSNYCAEDTILATNSSRMVSSLFKDFVKNPARLANLHYFNPALVMKLTEVVQGAHTSNETAEALMDFSVKTGKDPIWVRKEIDGFVVNRILGAITREANFLVAEGYVKPQEVDTAVEKGLNHPMGPYRLQDLTGVDLSFLVMKRNFEENGEKQPGYEMYEEMYNNKQWGRKTGKGFYEYPAK
ncbi:MAG: 3-hydroxyacyl-CoA dehydrogenase family protein [Ruminococcaceae bacterium]|nr:3-hydroxyacyl-CoA dehydrogenase family protein [Oscillospiraceae bacterium]